MVLLPAFNWLALTVSGAVAVMPEPERLMTPSDLLPSVKETEPVGVMLPAADTVAVSWVLPPAVMLVGLAVTVVVVATSGGGTTTVTDPDEELKPVLPP